MTRKPERNSSARVPHSVRDDLDEAELLVPEHLGPHLGEDQHDHDDHAEHDQRRDQWPATPRGPAGRGRGELAKVTDSRSSSSAQVPTRWTRSRTASRDARRTRTTRTLIVPVEAQVPTRWDDGRAVTDPTPHPATADLADAVREVEHHVAAAGWDAPVRVFALVRTQAALATEPGLADQLAPTVLAAARAAPGT